MPRTRSLSVLVLASLAIGGCESRTGARQSAIPAPVVVRTTPTPAPVAPAPVAPLAGAPLFTTTTHALVVGLLDFADPALTDFSTVDRRDVVVARTLVERGVPAANVVTLLDAQATRSAVRTALAAAADATPVGGTLVVYYAGHGTRTTEGDVAYLAYDTTASAPGPSGLSIAMLHDTLSPRLVGKRLLFLADCCHSGALGGLARSLSAEGVVAASLTSADASNTSTGNWTYTQVLLEGLRGDACLDADADGSIGIAELDRAVKDAMRFRERQRSGSFLDAVDPVLAIGLRIGPPRTGAMAGRFALAPGGEVVRVSRDDGTTAEVRAYDYARTRDSRVALASLHGIPATRYPVGAELVVEWGGRSWPAVVRESDGDFAFITYPGWPSYWDEWILEDRVVQVTRLPPGSRVDDPE